MSDRETGSEAGWIKLSRAQALDLIRMLMRDVDEVELTVHEALNIELRPAESIGSVQPDSSAQAEEEALIVLSESGHVRVEGHRTEPLTAKEFDLLAYLYSRQGALVSREDLCQALWPDGSASDPVGALDKLLSRLRLKIEPEPRNPRYLLTVRGRGYRLRTA